jgi:aryl-alcohol dehydrogenase-like predicted oxidoreductase
MPGHHEFCPAKQRTGFYHLMDEAHDNGINVFDTADA